LSQRAVTPKALAKIPGPLTLTLSSDRQCAVPFFWAALSVGSHACHGRELMDLGGVVAGSGARDEALSSFLLLKAARVISGCNGLVISPWLCTGHLRNPARCHRVETAQGCGGELLCTTSTAQKASLKSRLSFSFFSFGHDFSECYAGFLRKVRIEGGRVPQVMHRGWDF
jgi:hypothetical protein